MNDQKCTTMKSHGGEVFSCAFSPDGSRILSSSADETLRLWGLNGVCYNAFRGHNGPVLDCAFSPDGSRIISAGADRTIKIWSMEGDTKGDCIRTLHGHRDRVTGLAFGNAGRLFLSSSYDKTLKIWDIQGDCLRTFQGDAGFVQGCAFSPDSRYILSAHNNDVLKLWGTAGGDIRTLRGHEGRVLSCAFSPDGNSILSGAADNTLKIWDLDGNCLKTLHGHAGAVRGCAFSPDGNLILSDSGYRTLKIWYLNGNCLKTLQGHEGIVHDCAFSPDGSHIVSASADGTVKLWDISDFLATRARAWSWKELEKEGLAAAAKVEQAFDEYFAARGRTKEQPKAWLGPKAVFVSAEPKNPWKDMKEKILAQEDAAEEFFASASRWGEFTGGHCRFQFRKADLLLKAELFKRDFYGKKPLVEQEQPKDATDPARSGFVAAEPTETADPELKAAQIAALAASAAKTEAETERIRLQVKLLKGQLPPECDRVASHETVQGTDMFDQIVDRLDQLADLKGKDRKAYSMELDRFLADFGFSSAYGRRRQ